MAEFLTRHGIVHHLRTIIEDAEKELVLISPYIKADEETKDLLKDTKRSTRINVVYGKRELLKEEERFLNDLSITSTFRENLHAKCYLNEKQALLTSMNLYEFSMENNDEMGILVDKDNDPDIYEKIHRQAMRYVKSPAGETHAATGTIPDGTEQGAEGQPQKEKSGQGWHQSPNSRCLYPLQSRTTRRSDQAILQ